MLHSKSSTTRILAVAGAAGLLSVAAAASPASAATRQDGLINLSLTNTTVQVPVAVAANICGVAVNVLATAIAQGPVDCSAIGTSSATASRGGNSNTTQNGLVNVSATNTTVQVPVQVAANVCGVAVNLISSLSATSPVTCTTSGVAVARA